MNRLTLKIKKEYSNILKDLNEKQVGELVKGLCAYAYEDKPFFTKDDYLKGLYLYIKRDIDISKRNSVNGKKGAAVLAEKRRNAEGMLNGIGVILGSVISANEAKKNKLETP